MTGIADTAAAGNSGLLGALGINLGALILNALAFLIILYILSRFVYPALSKALALKEQELQAAAKAQQAAASALIQAQAQADDMVRAAREQAEAMLQSARLEGSEVMQTSKAKADAQALRIAQESQAQLGRDVAEARQALKQETAQLVAKATQIVLNEKLDAPQDAALIQRSLKASQ